MDKKRRKILSLGLSSALISLTSSTGVSAQQDKEQTNTLHVITNDTESISFRKFLSEKNGTVNATQALIDAITCGQPVEIPYNYILRIESSNIPVISGSRIFGQAGTTPKIYIDHTDTSNPQFKLEGYNRIESLAFRYPNQKFNLQLGESPIKYGPLFYGSGYFSEFRNLDIGNTYYGFLLGNKGASSSHVVIDNIIGSPIFRGLSLDCCFDVPRVSDVHFNYNYLSEENVKYGQELKQWIFDHATAFHIGRCDFATFFRLFSFGYHRGIYLRSERSLGSADNCRFISCDIDASRHPIWFQNWQNKVSVLDCKLVGGAKSNFMNSKNSEPSYNVIKASKKATAILDNVDINNYTSHAFVTYTDTIILNSRISEYGTAGKISAGVFVGSEAKLNIENTLIDGAGGAQTKGVYSNNSSYSLTLGCGIVITNQAYEGFLWAKGPVFVDNSIDLGGAIGITDLSLLTHVPKTYFSDKLPTYGNYFMPGDNIILTRNFSVMSSKSNDYLITGFKRLTPSNKQGDNHVINIDWLEERAYFSY